MMLTLATVALAVFLSIGQSISSVAVPGLDRASEAWVVAHQQVVLSRLFVGITVLGGITAMRIVALAGAIYLWTRRRRVMAIGVLAIPFAANAFFDAMKSHYARPRPFGLGVPSDPSYAFPSGHATVSTAVCATLAFVLWRDGRIGARTAAVAAIAAPLIIGASRVYLDVHWLTDVFGGWCAGLFIASLAAMLYDLVTRRQAVGDARRARSTPPTSRTYTT